MKIRKLCSKCKMIIDEEFMDIHMEFAHGVHKENS